uniref:Uncharacterized protein n=1 Tax=Glossina pallidipes TaxID=7398 RepID=A0A1B0A7C1_GLOPL
MSWFCTQRHNHRYHHYNHIQRQRADVGCHLSTVFIHRQILKNAGAFKQSPLKMPKRRAAADFENAERTNRTILNTDECKKTS